MVDNNESTANMRKEATPSMVGVSERLQKRGCELGNTRTKFTSAFIWWLDHGRKVVLVPMLSLMPRASSVVA